MPELTVASIKCRLVHSSRPCCTRLERLFKEAYESESIDLDEYFYEEDQQHGYRQLMGPLECWKTVLGKLSWVTYT